MFFSAVFLFVYFCRSGWQASTWHFMYIMCYTDGGFVSPTLSAKAAHNLPTPAYAGSLASTSTFFFFSHGRGAGVRPEGELRVHVRHD